VTLSKTIAGLRGRDPVGCVVRVGLRQPGKAPTDRHRFTICTTTQNAQGIRPMHPSFTPFNSRQGDRSSHPCSTVTMQIVHANRDDCFEAGLRAQVSPRSGSVPGMRPWCIGDGRRAERWDFERGEYAAMACPNEHCQFRQPNSGPRGSKACKPMSRLLARLIWRAERDDGLMPSMLAKFTSNSWNTASALQGYFDFWDNVAIDLTSKGADWVDVVESYDEHGELQQVITARRYSMLGARFTLTLQEKSDTDVRTGKKRRYPIVVIAPIDDPLEHLLAQTQRMRAIAEQGAMARAMLTDAQHSSHEERTIDFLENEVGGHMEGGE